MSNIKPTESAKKKRTAAKKSVSQTMAVADRRNYVKTLLQQHLPVREIAEKVGVKVITIEQDIRALDREAAGLHEADQEGRKHRELEELDQLEADAIKEYSQATKKLHNLDNPAKYFPALEPKDVRVEIAKALKKKQEAIAMRLKIKEFRAKWLGFEKKEAGPEAAVVNDNRSVIINVSGHPEDFVKFVQRKVEGGPDEHRSLPG